MKISLEKSDLPFLRVLEAGDTPTTVQVPIHLVNELQLAQAKLVEAQRRLVGHLVGTGQDLEVNPPLADVLRDIFERHSSMP